MIKIPEGIEQFAKLPRWWRVNVPTEVIVSADGISTLFELIESRGVKPFFVIDSALKDQPAFARIFAHKDVFEFNASYSEVRTTDVDELVSLLRRRGGTSLTLMGIGGRSEEHTSELQSRI